MNTAESVKKPSYPDMFNLVAGLPKQMKPATASLLLWIWRHTNSDKNNLNCGKAWVSHAELAREMHLGRSAIREAFNDAWAWGAISREHLFKKNGKIIVSSAPYKQKNSKGLGEYIGSRYWLNWDFIRQLQVGMSENGTPSEIGVLEFTTPIEKIGVLENDTPGLNSNPPVSKTNPPGLKTNPKVLIEVSNEGPIEGLGWVDGGVVGEPAAQFKSLSQNPNGQDQSTLPDVDKAVRAIAEITVDAGLGTPSITKGERQSLSKLIGETLPLIAPNGKAFCFGGWEYSFLEHYLERVEPWQLITIRYHFWIESKKDSLQRFKGLKHLVSAFIAQFQETEPQWTDFLDVQERVMETVAGSTHRETVTRESQLGDLSQITAQ